MDADYSVELGPGDPSLELPWRSDDGALQYHDLKRHPELLLYVDEANRYPELARFLSSLNSFTSIFATAKCDVWAEGELSEAEEIYGAPLKFGGYVDLLLEDGCAMRNDFEGHERLSRRAVELLAKAPEISAAAEFIIRRCYFQESGDAAAGYYWTAYIFGYGDDERDARKRWAIALEVVQNALLQVSAETRRAQAGK